MGCGASVGVASSLSSIPIEEPTAVELKPLSIVSKPGSVKEKGCTAYPCVEKDSIFLCLDEFKSKYTGQTMHKYVLYGVFIVNVDASL